MTFVSFVRKSAFRNRFRTVLTMLGMAVAVLGFLFLRTVVDVWNAGVAAAAQDRLATRNKTGITEPLPRTYFEKIKDLPGIDGVSFASWTGHINPADEKNFFPTFAVDGATYFKVYNEYVIQPDQFDAFMAEPSGAIVGATIAEKYGWKIGDTVNLRGTIYPGDWKFKVMGIYDTTTKAFDKMSVMFHWKYHNDGVSQVMKENVSWYAIRVKDPTQGPQVAQAVDKAFEANDHQTLTESERAFNLSFISMYAGVFTAMDIVSIIILLIMTLIVGNTIAMNVRDRTKEYGVLRAIGFKPKHLAVFVVGETAVVSLVGAAMGVVLSWPIVNGFGNFIEDNMAAMFPFFEVAPLTLGLAVILALVLGVAAGAVPAFQASRVPVTQALRRVG